MHDSNIRYFSRKHDNFNLKFALNSNDFFFNDQSCFSNTMASYFRMHLKVLFWRFYFKGELIIHGEKNQYTQNIP